MYLQLSSEQSVGDVWIVQLDRKRVPQARSSGCKSSVAVLAVTAECSRYHPSLWWEGFVNDTNDTTKELVTGKCSNCDALQLEAARRRRDISSQIENSNFMIFFHS